MPLGIDELAEDPGFHRVVLHPQFDASLGEVKATYDSSYGPITSNWKVDGNTIQWEVVIPPNTTGLIYLPGGVVEPGCWKLAKTYGRAWESHWCLRDSHNAIYPGRRGFVYIYR